VPYELLGAAIAVAVFILPVVLLSPIVDRIFENRQLRAIVRRAFRIDTSATVGELPSARAPHS
jgi:hypothetical protein